MEAILVPEDCQVLLVSGAQFATVQDKFLEELSESLGLPLVRDTGGELNPVRVEEIMSRLRASIVDKRHQSVLLAGEFLEDRVTAIALCALATGFSVYLVRDFVRTRSQNHGETSIARLLQAGVIPITASQILYEFAIAINDLAAKRAIKVLSEKLPSVLGAPR